MFAMDAVEDIKARLSIEDVIGEYVQLKRAGRNFKGISPWTNEKSASLMVSPEKQIWHDFSSARGGNVFSFVMEMEGLDFKGALELLARKAGVDLEQYKTSKGSNTGQLKERLHEALELAAKFYQVHFSKNSDAVEYIFKQRKFTKETAIKFQLGYAPNSGAALHTFLKKKGFTDAEMQKAGLITTRYSGVSDMFRGRIMVPLHDAVGQVIGFTARLLDDDPDAPKYINTPATLLYDKSRHVYGLHLAKEGLRKEGFAVLVEGNLDVVAAHQAGSTNVVATAGTALTESHLKTIGRFTSDIRLAFDEDAAGQAATERAIPIASKVGVGLSIITIPDGKDPDELIRKNKDAWLAALQNRRYALDWLINRYEAVCDLSTAVGKKEFTDALVPTLRLLNDAVEQDHYISEIAKRIGVEAAAMRTKVQKSETTKRHLKQGVALTDQQLVKEQMELLKTQDRLLALLLMQPALRYHMKLLEEGMMVTEPARQLFVHLVSHPDFTGESELTGTLQDMADYVKVLGLQYEELYQGLELLELRNEAARLQARVIERYVKAKKAVITRELINADEQRTQELLEQARAFDALLKKQAV